MKLDDIYPPGEDDESIADITDLVIPKKISSNSKSLDEGRYISGLFQGNIRLDKAHAAGQDHAHVTGRVGTKEIVVNLDGTSSHGTRGRLSKKDAAALANAGYNIRKDRIVEYHEKTPPSRAHRLITGL